MRVRFGELSLDERTERDRMAASAREAWRCVACADAESARQLFEAIDDRLVFELRTVDEAGARCAELAALEPSAWPLAEWLLEQAPADVGCALALGRAAVPLEQALVEVREQCDVELARATLRAGFGRGHLLELTLGVPGGLGSESEQNAAENLVRLVLGERLFETWVGQVHATPAPRGGSLRVLDINAPRTTLTLPELFDTVAAATLGVLRGFASARSAGAGAPAAAAGAAVAARGHVDVAAPHDLAREEWTLLEVEPLAQSRAGRKDDLLLASTCTPELLRCYLDGSPCASRRFARAGERFVFVSYADDAPTLEARLQRRTAIESALASAVADVGAITGVGFGVETTYVDLALCNLETGLSQLIAKLRDVRAPLQTFIQFFDSELAEEWLSSGPTRSFLTGELAVRVSSAIQASPAGYEALA